MPSSYFSQTHSCLMDLCYGDCPSSSHLLGAIQNVTSAVSKVLNKTIILVYGAFAQLHKPDIGFKKKSKNLIKVNFSIVGTLYFKKYI